jgi:hypothetical protein
LPQSFLHPGMRTVLKAAWIDVPAAHGNCFAYLPNEVRQCNVQTSGWFLAAYFFADNIQRNS